MSSNSSVEHHNRSSTEICSSTTERNTSHIPHRSFHHCQFSTLNQFDRVSNEKFTYCRGHSTHQDPLEQRIHCSTTEKNRDGEDLRISLTMSIVLIIASHLSSRSPAVLQLFPTSMAHKAGLSTPHSMSDTRSRSVLSFGSSYRKGNKRSVDRFDSKHYASLDNELRVLFHRQNNCRI